MVSGPQQSGTTSAAVVLGTIVQVYPGTRTVDVEVDLSGESDIYSNVPYGTLYTNVVTGTHIDFVPEVGSKCFVYLMSDGSDPVVMGWLSAPLHGAFSEDDAAEPDDDFLGGRMGLAPGDIALYNSRGATVLLRKGGTLQIGSSPLAQTLYIPIDNFIRHFFQNYEAKSLLGTLFWKHGTIQTGDDKTAAQLYWGMKKDVEDQHVTIKVRAGRAGDDQFSPSQDELFGSTRDKAYKFGSGSYPGNTQETTLISICVDPENTGCTYTFQVDTLGNVFTKVTGDMHWEMDTGHVYAENGFVVEFGSAGKLTGESDGSLKATVQELVVEALSGISLSSGTGSCTIDSGTINLGSNVALESAVLGKVLMGMLAAHVHMPPAPVPPGAPPITGVPTADWIASLESGIALSSIVKLSG